MNLLKQIKQICPEDKFQIGFASLNGCLNDEYKEYNYGISLLKKLDDNIIDDISNGPTNEYLNLYNETNSDLAGKIYEISLLLNNYKINNCIIPPTIEESEMDDDFLKKIRYKFSHKMIATRAGLGWIGKTDLLISKRFGPRVRLASILLDKELTKPGIPIDTSKCGKCNLCVERCPADAATGQLWNIDIDRDRFYNPFICMNYCRKITKEKINKEKSICGICISVCPIGRNT